MRANRNSHSTIIIGMEKTYSLFAIKQKKKNFLALCIRLSILIAIPLLYFFSSASFNGNDNDFDQGEI